VYPLKFRLSEDTSCIGIGKAIYPLWKEETPTWARTEPTSKRLSVCAHAHGDSRFYESPPPQKTRPEKREPYKQIRKRPTKDLLHTQIGTLQKGYAMVTDKTIRKIQEKADLPILAPKVEELHSLFIGTAINRLHVS